MLVLEGRGKRADEAGNIAPHRRYGTARSLPTTSRVPAPRR
eukprot:COSAG01_NODE_9564_length_2408_cov_5.157211_1_plen_40_part_10